MSTYSTIRASKLVYNIQEYNFNYIIFPEGKPVINIMYFSLVSLSCAFHQVETEQVSVNSGLQQLEKLWDSGQQDQFPEIIIEMSQSIDDPVSLWRFGTEVFF